MNKIRSVRGNAWSRLVAGDYTPSQAALHQLGQYIIECIVAEAHKDLIKQKALTKDGPVGVPDSDAFFQSFTYRITNGNIEILCDWPTIDALMEGRAPFPMSWLTREKGVGVVPLKDDHGDVIFRMAPQMKDAWIHPGFQKHNFIRRGVEKGRQRTAEIIKQDLLKFIQGS